MTWEFSMLRNKQQKTLISFHDVSSQKLLEKQRLLSELVHARVEALRAHPGPNKADPIHHRHRLYVSFCQSACAVIAPSQERLNLFACALCNKCWHHESRPNEDCRWLLKWGAKTLAWQGPALSNGRRKETRKMGCMRFFSSHIYILFWSWK